ncbi:MAG TPA: NUDIX domain-containing protein [Steroidobacter sp.]|uniref:NUDIX domain-containing protein n=1 Tax=Steroidobacter sp. TaxID=1978227 RepID=UPI002EDA6281
MELRTDPMDLWAFSRGPDGVRYLLLHTSQEKADRFFNGGRFWQIPATLIEKDESVVAAGHRCLSELGLVAKSIWAVEHVYPIYNRRFDSMMLIPVFAAEVEHTDRITLDWEHSESRWCTADECQQLLSYRGLLEGLHWTRAYITESPSPRPEFQLA